MADQTDIAREHAEQMLADALAQRVRYSGESAAECRDCGEPIPAARRASIPGVETCVHCQELRERSARGLR